MSSKYFSLLFLRSVLEVSLQNVAAALTAIFPLAVLFQAPLIALQAAMPSQDLASATAAYALFRTLGKLRERSITSTIDKMLAGAAMGVSIGGAIYSSTLLKRIHNVSGYTLTASNANNALSVNVGALSRIVDPTTREQVLYAFTKSISAIWIFDTCIVFLGLILDCFLKQYTLKRPVNRSTVTPAVAEEGESKISQEPTKETR